MIQIDKLEPAQALEFDWLTFPGTRWIVKAPQGKDLNIALARDSGGAPVGLALGWGGPNGTFELISLYVVALFRRHGAGSRLLEFVESDFTERGYRLGTHLISTQDLQCGPIRFLRHSGWSPPRVQQILCRASVSQAFKTSWMVATPLPATFSIVSWFDVNDEQRAAIRARKADQKNWYSDDQDPFVYEKGSHRGTSVALLRGSEVLGWVLTHLPNELPEAVRWTVSFVSPELQRRGLILPLWMDAVRRQQQTTPREKICWCVPIDHPRMLRFVQRRMLGHGLESMTYSCVLWKRLAPPPQQS